MNLILADRTEDSKETESTNGLGKSTLIRIINFCLGSELSRDKVLTHPELNNVTFFLDLEWDGAECTVSRNTAKDKHIRVTSNFIAGIDVESINFDDSVVEISLESWRAILSTRFFPDAVYESKFSPSFRDIYAYVSRLGRAAYVDPQIAFQNQSGAARRLCVSFMLQLNWAKQREMHLEAQRREQNSAALEALRLAEETNEVPTIGDLEAKRVACEMVLSRKRDEVEHFNVREDYKELENSLHDVDKDIHDLINDNHSDRRLLDYYHESAKDTPEADPKRPLAILRDAGAVFKDEALRTIEAVSEFHQAVYRNRHEFLSAEVKRLASEIEVRDRQIDRLSGEKQRLLRILRSSGALETLIELQRAYSSMNAEYEVLLSKIQERKRYDQRDEEIAAKIAAIRRVIKLDLEDRRHAVDEVRVLFAEFTSVLYGKPGRLIVDVGNSGYRFSFVIDREGSDGVGQMVVFCFDLAVACMWAKRDRGLRVLIHDSTLFADVDPRQVAAAISLAARISKEYKLQYICCLNSGTLAGPEVANIDVAPWIRLRLTDDGPHGRLLGMRLRPRERDDLEN